MILLCIKRSDNPKAESKRFLECVLQEHCKIESPQSKLRYNDHGKPLIDGTVFSVSHSEHALCIALQCEQVGDSAHDYTVYKIQTTNTADSIGVDIECVDNKTADRCKKIAKAKFFDSEQQLLQEATTEQDYVDTFCKMWTAKECYCKYTGVGLSDAIGFQTGISHDGICIYTDIISMESEKYAVSICYNS